MECHRAGSVAAVELLIHLEEAHAGTPITTFASALRAEIEGEIQELEGLISRTRKALRELYSRWTLSRNKGRLDLQDVSNAGTTPAHG